jgi:hypothetical protein
MQVMLCDAEWIEAVAFAGSMRWEGDTVEQIPLGDRQQSFGMRFHG